MEYGLTKQPLGVPLIPSQSVFLVVESYYWELIFQAAYLVTPKLWVLCLLLITTSTVTIIEKAAMWFSSMVTTEKGINAYITITVWVCHTSCHPKKLDLSWKCYENLMLSSSLARSHTNRRQISTISQMGMTPPRNSVLWLGRSKLCTASLHMGM